MRAMDDETPRQAPEAGAGQELICRLQKDFEGHLKDQRLSSALDLGRRLLVLLDRYGDPRGAGKAEAGMGGALLACGRPQEAKAAFRRARNLLRQHGVPVDLAHGYYNLGLACGRCSRLALAKAALRRAADRYGSLGLHQDRSEAQVFLAYTEMLLGELPEALATLDRVGDEVGVGPAFRPILHQTRAEIYARQGLKAKAKAALASRFLAGVALADAALQADSLYRMALLHRSEPDPWIAEAYLAEAQHCIRGQGHDLAEARIRALGRELRPAGRGSAPKGFWVASPWRRCS